MYKTWIPIANWFMRGLLVLGFAWAIAAVQILSFARHSATASADAALVLGAAAWGNRPSPVYRERIAQAIELFEARRVHWIVLTGGSPASGYPSEAEVGRRYCISHGVPEEAIIVEARSRTTWENLAEARQVMARENIRTVLLVSDPFHMKRAIAMARAQGVDAQPAPTATSRFRSWRTRSVFLWHETWRYVAFMLFGVRD